MSVSTIHALSCSLNVILSSYNALLLVQKVQLFTYHDELSLLANVNKRKRVYETTGTTVGMGRCISDGGWCFHVIDVAVLPEHQRTGVGDMIMSAPMEKIRRESVPGASVNLLADPPARNLYKRHGFVETAPGEVGMGVWLR